VLLKTLSLVGFKSFAGRTRLEFDPGVNVVVGPNGSGKSNLVDALAWVMGTQATRSLRTARMEDVIFAGTATRPAVGRAEVTLTFDNRDRFLPLDLDDLSMTRRLFRDGTSEYELNGTPCRLLDLHEILADGGVGRHQHALVGQGQIGEILNARPDEHRAVIEEAAGITKHRGRRDRAVRRLEQTGLDMLRLTDLLDQEKKRLRPLKRQADAALRHDSVRDEIRALRLWMGGEALRELDACGADAAGRREEAEKAILIADAELDDIVGALDGLRRRATDVGRVLEADTAAAARLETASERFSRIATVARERRHSLQDRLDGADQRRRDLAAEHDALVVDLAELDRLDPAARVEVERAEVELHALEDEERSLAEQAQLPAEGVVANLRGDLRSLEIAAERDRGEAERLSARRREVVARLAEDNEAAQSIVEEIHEVDAAAGEARDRFEEAVARRRTSEAEGESAAERDLEARVALTEARARLEAYEVALRGVVDSEARQIAESADGVAGSLVGRLDVPPALAVAVDAALGGWAAAMVASDPDVVQQVAATVKAAGGGGIGLVVGHRRPIEPPARAVAAEWGAEALVDRLGPNAGEALATRLLGDVVVVEGWSAAWRLVERHPSLRAVTPEGDLVSINGVRLGDPDGAGHALLESAKVAADVADREVARTASLRTTSARALDMSRAAEESARATLERLEARLGGLTATLAMNGRARAEREAELIRLDDRHRALLDSESARATRIAETRDRLQGLEGEQQAHQEVWEAINARRAEVAGLRVGARRRRDEAAAVVAGHEERRRWLDARLATIAGDAERAGEDPVDPHLVDRLTEIERWAAKAVTEVRSHVEQLRARQRESRAGATEADQALQGAYERQRRLERDAAAARQQVSTLAVELAEIRVTRQARVESLRREADAETDEALAAPKPKLEPGADPEAVLAAGEAALRRMGPVNPLAAAEYEELAAHVSLLDGQLADLEESKAQLRKVIAALDVEMATLFTAAFEEIDELFAENFALVFPGGRGRLRLTDPDRPLETGVELEAQPRGKKIGRLSLLSGGERSLAALAFLFAVFRARPSPFYVLDEVEAALDDANLRRFLRLVETLRGSAQLVIVTHQQQTMEAADLLYGVTMEPGESSQAVSKRIRVGAPIPA
jgi:chromosome segregation protein